MPEQKHIKAAFRAIGRGMQEMRILEQTHRGPDFSDRISAEGASEFFGLRSTGRHEGPGFNEQYPHMVWLRGDGPPSLKDRLIVVLPDIVAEQAKLDIAAYNTYFDGSEGEKDLPERKLPPDDFDASGWQIVE